MVHNSWKLYIFFLEFLATKIVFDYEFDYQKFEILLN